MTVVDIRDELYKRQIEIVEVTEEHIYYAEEKNVEDIDAIYLLDYNCVEEQEKVMAYFTFDDSSYIQHYYASENSIIILFENDSSKIWIVKIDKATGSEVLRKSVPLVGKFSSCVMIDDNNLVIYTKADEESKGLFNRCLETTDSETIANLYDLERGYRYFIKDFRTARLLDEDMHRFTDSKGREYMLLCDPFSDETSKEAYAGEAKKIDKDVRDNIWSISKKRFLDGVKAGKEQLELKRIASAGIDGMVRFECISGDSIVFRAKKFSTGQETFCAMSTVSGKVVPVSAVKKRSGKVKYFTDNGSGKIYRLVAEDNLITLEGEVNSNAQITVPHSIGRIEGCIDDRFVVADNSSREEEPVLSLYDSRLNTLDTFQAHGKTKGKVLVLF